MQEEIQLSKEELARYSRHIIIPEFNIEGQKKLKAAKVLVIGTGGLGSPMLLYLAAAGVGTIGIVDFDVVDDSNLQRQVLFDVKDVGRPKVEAARERILGLNPHINVIAYNEHLSSKNALEIFKDYDVVADGTDNFPTRYLVNDACVLTGIPNVYASIYRFDGQVSVFNYNNGPNYRDLYPEPPPPGLVPSCAEGGVLGVLPGIIGSLQANEVIKVITGIGETLSGRLFSFDALNFTTRIFKVAKDKNNPLTGEHPTLKELIDYQQFCGIVPEAVPVVKEISVQELKQKFDAKEDFQLIDVREQHEYDFVNLGAELIPLNSITEQQHRIARDKPVVVHCKAGTRSAKAIAALEQYGFTNLYNLKGGIVAYAKEIDTRLPVY
ncbi:MAG TPA: molybdopterin-synthase adenylyltransferase MoeB [Chitinophagales bacterium]|jgi:adenylyltransferase/sulfurtransferase|nr:molybdopterin-synthase adenylyltransferase MoeB [Chitinophagales bacterium]HPA35109.1 molybdopterin-synthase adenylyltransferase MoeB [Chitinophagales bacterium]HQO32024.1 molybdopterin-synthase adenylyltransferase MoeB [Chitinophagales bacterium]HQO89485.1 molybdopterin-synthase adenylyltransferase MoeB [Chitinophagales bacterium]